MKNPLEKKILFLKVKNQDKEAYAKFYDLYIERIHRFIFFKVNSTSEAQDLTSETFLKLWQAIREGREIRNLNAFIYVIARNLVIDFYRRQSSENCSTDEVAESLVATSHQEIIDRQTINSELGSVIKGLDNLKDEYKEVIVMKFLDEMSIGEIAEVVKKSRGAVRVLIHRALKALRENLQSA